MNQSLKGCAKYRKLSHVATSVEENSGAPSTTLVSAMGHGSLVMSNGDHLTTPIFDSADTTHSEDGVMRSSLEDTVGVLPTTLFS
ncbi:hypothetical protein V6N13_101108 [Hibiscus sabdariffa]|uniref:Uncharacterized protein n=1 Tax=Hibiscus sabdariffa TaxID=183260 RepID=A0ABR2QL08_9ROSI